MNDTLLITNAEVLDINTGTYQNQDVRCFEGNITEVGPHLARRSSEDIIDARGTFLLPGLIDVHVHVTAGSADLGSNRHRPASYTTAQAAGIMRGMLSRGFTSVRDVGGADFGLAEAQKDGLIPGPRIYFGGQALSQTGGHGDFRGPGDDVDPLCGHGIGRVVDGVDGVRVAARDEIRKGADHIKIMASGGVASPTDRIDSSQYSEDEIRAVVAEARAANRYVAAHAYTARSINRALRCGVRSIEHGNLLDHESLRLFQANDAFLVPTLVTYWALQRERGQHGHSEEHARKVDAVMGKGLDSLEAAHTAGVKIAYGSDLLGSMHHYQNEEFRIRSEVQPNLAVLQSATVVAAQLLGREGNLGEISIGAAADLILVERDPLEDIAVLAEPEKYLRSVIQAGKIAG